ncbi:MAG: hypothetical protein AAF433_06490 [Bacteroidota bacterium]
MPSHADEQQKLRSYRPRKMWVRLVSLFTYTLLLSEQEVSIKPLKVQQREVKIYFAITSSSWPVWSGIETFFETLFLLLMGVSAPLIYQSLFGWFVGILFLVIGVLLVLNFILGKGTLKEGGSMVFDQESLQLPGTGEFMWENIVEIVFKERSGKLKALFVQLSNGTIVEHRVKVYNKSSNGRVNLSNGHRLRELLFTYWKQANSLELDPNKAPVAIKQNNA